MIPFTGRLGLKQYMKGKPNPWGIKEFFLCRESGMPYDFLAYQGKTTKLPEKYNHFGLSGGLVMSLLEDRVKAHGNYHLFFDNYFTFSSLVVVADQTEFGAGEARQRGNGWMHLK